MQTNIADETTIVVAMSLQKPQKSSYCGHSCYCRMQFRTM